MEKVWIGALLVAAGLVSGWKANAGPTQCPTVNISVPEGSSEIIVPDTSGYPNSLFLRRKNHSSSSWNYIANIRNGTLIPFLSVYSARFSVWGQGLVVVNASRFLTGEYQLCDWLTETCLQHFFLDVGGPTQCPVVNISLAEGSSGMMMPNISSCPKSLVLCKKNHSSSFCEPIANIRNGTLTMFLSSYKAHISIVEHGLVVGNASRFLKGEYELGYHLDKICLKHFFLDVSALGSKRTNDGVIAAAVLVLLVLVVLFARWCKQRRGRPAHPSTGVPDTGNEPLHPMTVKTEETRIDTPSAESRTAVNGML